MQLTLCDSGAGHWQWARLPEQPPEPDAPSVCAGRRLLQRQHTQRTDTQPAPGEALVRLGAQRQQPEQQQEQQKQQQRG